MTTPTQTPIPIGDTLTRLASLPALLADLETTLTRQHRLRTQPAGRTGRRQGFPLLYNAAASAATDSIELVLKLAVARLTHNLGTNADPAEQARALHAFLADLDSFAHSLAAAVDHGLAVIDCPPDRLYLGSCENCHTALYAEPNATTTGCSTCHTEYEVAPRQDQMLTRVRYQYRTAAELARLLPWVDDSPVTEAAITKAGQRGTLHSQKIDGRVVYQIGDVLDWHRARIKAPDA